MIWKQNDNLGECQEASDLFLRHSKLNKTFSEPPRRQKIY